MILPVSTSSPVQMISMRMFPPANRTPTLAETASRRSLTTMAAIPEQYLDLLTQKTAFAHIATVQPDGSPQVTPVWFDYTDGKVRVNVAKSRVKIRNMKEGAPVALSIMDPDNAYRYI